MFERFNFITIPVALFIDVLLVSICVVVLLRYGRLSHSHPATIYLFFHHYTFTLRPIGVMLGAPTMLSQYENRDTRREMGDAASLRAQQLIWDGLEQRAVEMYNTIESRVRNREALIG